MSTGSSRPTPVFIEIGTRKVFATALMWPGWSRSARTEEDALTTLSDYAPRYEHSIGAVARQLGFPVEPVLEIVERLDGGKGTDFGVPEIVCESDMVPLVGAELERHTALLTAAWRAFDRTATKYAGRELRRGPRGGGRSIAEMVDHVHGADVVFALPVGAALPPPSKGEPPIDEVRNAFLKALDDRAAGRRHDTGRKTKKVWPPRYAVRRSAWHSLDHAWEMEDKVLPSHR